MRSWWRGTRLVAERTLRETIRSRSFRVVTAVVLLLSVAAIVVPQLVGDEEERYTLATVGPAPAELVAVLDAAARAGEVTVEYVTRPDEAAARAAVGDGDVDAALVGDTLYVEEHGSSTFPVLVSQAVVAVQTTRMLADAGLTDDQIQALASVRPPRQVEVGEVDDSERLGLAFMSVVVLYMALNLAGDRIATTVGLEKSTRISEVLLAVLRPSQVLVGTVLAVGALTLAQLVVLAAPLAVAVQVTDTIGLPAVAGGDLALAVVWFLLAFALYSFAFAATAALVDKITEVSSAIMPVTMTMLVGYLLGLMVVIPDPEGPWAVVLSLFPLSAPLVMPGRWASGEVPVVQLVLAMALTAAGAVLLVLFASRIYRRALLITGRRVRLRELVGPSRP